MKARLEISMKDLRAQVKKAESLLNDLKTKVAKIDKETARAGLDRLKDTGSAEMKKIRNRLQDQIMGLSQDLSKTSAKLKTESDRVRTRVKGSLENVKKQLKTIAEKERSKRRG